ncbi:MAG: dTDP-4-dehydrorhamnose reductase [Roseobacter sp.]
MKILVLGQTGQLATELSRLGTETLQVRTVPRAVADFNDPGRLAGVVAEADADVIINAVAYTAVDAAEKDSEAAYRVNGEAPTVLAAAAARRSLPFLHVSTDYVFNGSGDAPWQESNATAPLGAYGASKLAGEEGVRAAGGCHAVLRTSWVVSAHGNNFVKTMLRLGAERDALSIVADQIGGPTPAGAIAQALVDMASQLRMDRDKSGTYHFSGAPDVSWADFAREIFRQSGTACDVSDIPSSAYPTPAKRPGNSRMDCTKLETVFGIARPDWRVGLAGILEELKEVTS